MPAAMNVMVATSDRTDNRDKPQTPWPEVQLLPHTAPKPVSNPATIRSGVPAPIVCAGRPP